MQATTISKPVVTTLDSVINKVCNRHNIQPQDLRVNRRRSTNTFRSAKQMATWLAKQYTTATNREIMTALGLQDDKSLHTNIKKVDETLMQYGRLMFAARNRDELLKTIRTEWYCNTLLALNTEIVSTSFSPTAINTDTHLVGQGNFDTTTSGCQI